MNLQRERENHEKRKQLEEGQKLVSLVQKQLEEERKEKAQHKSFMKQQLDEYMRLKQEHQEYEKQLQTIADKEQYQLMQEKTQKEIEKEKKYHQYFQDYDKLMANRIRSHISAVSTLEYKKSQKLNNWIQKNESEYQQRLKEREKQLSQWRMNNNLNTKKILNEQIEQKNLEREQMRKIHDLEVEEGLKVSQANSELNLLLKKEKTEQQKDYYNVLNTQVRLKNEIYSKYGTMTENERKINNHDLMVSS